MGEIRGKRLARVVGLRPCNSSDMAALKEGLKVVVDLLLHLSRLSKHLAACRDMKGPYRGLGSFSRYLKHCSCCLGTPRHSGPHSPPSKAVRGQPMESGLQGRHRWPVIGQQGHLQASKQ